MVAMVRYSSRLVVRRSMRLVRPDRVYLPLSPLCMSIRYRPSFFHNIVFTTFRLSRFLAFCLPASRFIATRAKTIFSIFEMALCPDDDSRTKRSFGKLSLRGSTRKEQKRKEQRATVCIEAK